MYWAKRNYGKRYLKRRVHIHDKIIEIRALQQGQVTWEVINKWAIIWVRNGAVSREVETEEHIDSVSQRKHIQHQQIEGKTSVWDEEVTELSRGAKRDHQIWEGQEQTGREREGQDRGEVLWGNLK